MKNNEKKIREDIKENEYYKTTPRGISLIVLVITIIVIIILASAVIFTLNKNNPIEEANKARYESDVANMQAIFTNVVTKVMAQNQSTIEIDAGELNSAKVGANSTEGRVNYKLDNPQDDSKKEGIIIFNTGTNNDTTYYTSIMLPLYSTGETTWYVDNDGNLSLKIGDKKYGNIEYDTNTLQEPPIEPVEPEEPLDPKYEIAKGKVKEFIDINGQKAIIPINFAVVPGKDIVKNGLVISDVENDKKDIGNQFVWIPVNNVNNCIREPGYRLGNIQTELNGKLDFAKCSEPLNYGGVVATDSETKEFSNLANSVTEYKGFYVGRYEVSSTKNDNNGSIIESKKNKYPISSSIFVNIVEDIRRMYPEEKAIKGQPVSTLMYGVTWDETIRFIKNNYPGVEKDSTGYGNYSTKIIVTGSNEKYSLNNIYDMAGNVGEWTMESYETTKRIVRGGEHLTSSNSKAGLKEPISYRSAADFFENSNIYRTVGARALLYIK